LDNDDSRVRIELSPAAAVEQLLSVGQIRRARELAAETVSENPDDPLSYFVLGRVLLAMSDAKGAFVALEQALEREPEWDAAWALYASALFRLGRFKEAERSIIEAIRLSPDRASFFNEYARFLSWCGKKEKALELARRAIELDPDDEDAHQLFASLLHQVSPSKWQLSEEAARRAVSLNPDDADGLAILGALVLTQRRYQEAEELFRSALEIAPHNPLALEGLAQLVMRKNVLYRPFLSYALIMRKLGTAAQVLVVFSLWAIVSLLRATLLKGTTASSIVLLVYFAFAVYTWFAEPAMRAILRRKYHWL
jgi:tetratricopeptide (TPR) repeat protein